jgi:hypothetical protein
MKRSILYQLGVFFLGTLLFASCKKEPGHHHCDGDDKVVTTTKVFATGLNNPRGLKFGDDGYLYVAEGGVGGTEMSTKCMQVVPPVGPYKGSTTGSRISRIDNKGMRTTWVDNLPSSVNAMGDISGVGDVAFMGSNLYAVITGAGCSHGVPSIPNSLIKINSDRSWTQVADLSQWLMANPVKHPEPDDFEPDGDWYSLSYVNGSFFAIEANHGVMARISSSGVISRVVDVSATYGHIVPTSQAYHNGDFYIGNLDTFPAPHGGSSVYKVTMGGHISQYAKGFNMILGLAFDKDGAMYVLESTTNNPFPTPGTGDIVKVDPSGSRMVIASGLNFPTGMTFGPDGKLYVSNWGYGAPGLGQGQVLQITFKCDEIQGEDAH